MASPLRRLLSSHVGREPLSRGLPSHVQWILKKKKAGQDAILLGPPGPLKRNIVQRAAHMLGLEVEHVTLTSETTESDLRQRKELRDGRLVFEDQAPVRAALHGRILLLDGIEKVERNVLPALNNLLENREMHLDDGRVLVHPSRKSSLGHDNKQFLACHPNFFVVALGLPVPRYPGFALDPPLRSRFQARHIRPFESTTDLLSSLSLATHHRMDSTSLTRVARMYNNDDDADFFFESSARRIAQLFNRCDVAFAKSHLDVVCSFFHPEKSMGSTLNNVHWGKDHVTIDNFRVDVRNKDANVVLTSSMKSALAQMILSHHQLGTDFCVFGKSGTGKTSLVKLFAKVMGFEKVVSVFLYRDLGAREMLQKRIIDDSGQTAWVESDIVAAARNQEPTLLILDGLHRIVETDCLAMLHQLIEDRKITLPSGGYVNAGKHLRIVAIADDLERGQEFPEETIQLFNWHHFAGSWDKQEKVHLTQALKVSDSEKFLQAWEKYPETTMRNVVRIARYGDPELYEYYFGAQNMKREVTWDAVKVSSSTSHTLKSDPEVVSNPYQPFLKNFYPNAHQENVLNLLVALASRGERNMLLIGVQGAGKNVVAERLCQLMGWKRQYMSLNRDTTVQSLQYVPQVEDKKIIFLPSALSECLIHGRTLILDELDKASVEVTSVLKGILADEGEFFFQGQRVAVHPNFRIIALANKAGFPFLGNDVSRIGDLFSVVVLPNPQSVLDILRSYAPNVSVPLLTRLADVFLECQQITDGYPYNTREAIAVAKHLQMFPTDSVAEALRNVFSFEEPPQKVLDILNRHGFSLEERVEDKNEIFGVVQHFPLSKSLKHGTVESERQMESSDVSAHVRWQDVTYLFQEKMIVKPEWVNERAASFTFHVTSFALTQKNLGTLCSVLERHDEIIFTTKSPSRLGRWKIGSNEMTIWNADFLPFTRSPMLHVVNDHVVMICEGTSSAVLFLPDDRFVAVTFPDSDSRQGGASPFSFREGTKIVASSTHLTAIYPTASSKKIVSLNLSDKSARCWEHDAPVKDVQSVSGGSLFFLDKNNSAHFVHHHSGAMFPLSGASMEWLETLDLDVCSAVVNSKSLWKLFQVGERQVSSFGHFVWSPKQVLYDPFTQHVLGLAQDGQSLSCIDLHAETIRTFRLKSSYQNLWQGSHGRAMLSSEKSICLVQHDVASLTKDFSLHEGHNKRSVEFAEALSGVSAPVALHPDVARAIGGGVAGSGGMGGTGGDGANLVSDGRGGFTFDANGNIIMAELVQFGKELDPELQKALAEAEAERSQAEAQSLARRKGSLYEQIVQRVQSEVEDVKDALKMREAKEKENEVQRLKTQGELDETRLVDAVLGELNVFKKRAPKEQKLGLAMRRPKMIHVVLDLSASMARFNDWDQRLDREMDACVILMEALCGFEYKFKFKITGHSGSGIFVLKDWNDENTERKRQDVVVQMRAHAVGSATGDITLQAMEEAVDEISSHPADERLVVAFSDCNLGRYGVRPEHLEVVFKRSPNVRTHAVFIAEPVAAAYFQEALPGAIFHVQNTEMLPLVMKRILLELVDK